VKKPSVELEAEPVEICSALLKIGLTAVEPRLNCELEFDQESNQGSTFIADRVILDFQPSSDLGG
jgi:hypothetical protein